MKDALARDFTMNSLMYDYENAKVSFVLDVQVLDFCSGEEDIQKMVLRTPINPEETFKNGTLALSEFKIPFAFLEWSDSPLLFNLRSILRFWSIARLQIRFPCSAQSVESE